MSDPTDTSSASQPNPGADDPRTTATPLDGEPTGDADNGKPDPSPEDKAQAEKDRVQKRMDRLTAERRRAERERDEARGRLSVYEQQQSKPQGERPARDTSRQPKPEDFSTDGETYDQAAYLDALADWKVDQKLGKRDQETQVKKAGDSLRDSIAAQTKADPTFSDRLADLLDDVPLRGTAADAALTRTADNPGAVLDYLTKNPAEAEALAGLDYERAVKRIGRIEDRIEAAKATPPSKPAPGAALPSPVSPVGGRSGSGQKDPDKMTDAEYADWRAKQNAEERRNRSAVRGGRG